MMSSLDFRCELRIAGGLSEGTMLAQMLSIGMHVGVRIVAYMFEKMQ